MLDMMYVLVWVGLGELVLGTVSILATVTLMAATSFTSQFNWTFYSGPWVNTHQIQHLQLT